MTRFLISLSSPSHQFDDQTSQVANEETVLAVGFFIIVAAAARSIGAPYSSWANGHIERITNILQGAREEHTKAITERMDSVKEMREVVPLTQNLYAVAKVSFAGPGLR